jgi:hypothetical protein
MMGGLVDRLFPALVRGVVNALTLHHTYGFGRSARSGLPLDASGAPLPWYTYPAIEYLSQVDFAGRRVFEYGAGNSTLFWQARGARVAGVESDPAWHAKLSRQDPAPRILLRERREEYVRSIEEAEGPFDVVAIDGRWRHDCAKAAPAQLAPGGAIVLDNSDLHPRSARALREAGFLQVDFSGFGPVNPYTWTTSLFLRADCSLQRGLRDPKPLGGLDQHEAED